MPINAKPLPFKKDLTGISKKALEIHHDKLYQGYVTKANEISSKLVELHKQDEFINASNQTYSEMRSLRDGETFAENGVYLHEYYFGILGGDGKPSGALVDTITEQYDSLDNFIRFFSASGMAARGWVVLAWNTQLKRLKVYGADAHNQGGVWGCIPIIVLDVYEHAYFMDYGADRKAYIADFWKNLNWDVANALYDQAKSITIKL